MKEGYKLRSIALDAKPRPPRFAAPNSAEVDFNRQLRKIARASGNIVDVHVDGHIILDPHGMTKALADYARLITPWAERKASQMVDKVIAHTARAWLGHTKVIGRDLRKEILGVNTDGIARKLVNEQVGLIKSLPLEAGTRAQSLAMEAAVDGSRAADVANELKRTTEVTEGRATLIARTEVARSNAAINQTRAQSVGANTYLWRTMGDAAVRDSHADMEGVVCSYDDPPSPEGEEEYNPGEFPNCRCFAEPIVDEDSGLD